MAIEFDYYYDTATNDPSWNHIAVMVPVVKTASEGDNLNTADHSHNTLAMVEGVTLPALNEGFHSVSITYDVFNSDKWQNLQTEWQMSQHITGILDHGRGSFFYRSYPNMKNDGKYLAMSFSRN